MATAAVTIVASRRCDQLATRVSGFHVARALGRIGQQTGRSSRGVSFASSMSAGDSGWLGLVRYRLRVIVPNHRGSSKVAKDGGASQPAISAWEWRGRLGDDLCISPIRAMRCSPASRSSRHIGPRV
jgi:hypothetical protein